MNVMNAQSYNKIQYMVQYNVQYEVKKHSTKIARRVG